MLKESPVLRMLLMVHPRPNGRGKYAGRLYALARHHEPQWLGPAADFWQRFIDKHPHNVEAWAELGYVYWFLQEQKDGMDFPQHTLVAFTKAMELGLEDGGLVLDRIGHLYQRTGPLERSRKSVSPSCKNNPEQSGYCLGVSLNMPPTYIQKLCPWVLAAD